MCQFCLIFGIRCAKVFKVDVDAIKMPFLNLLLNVCEEGVLVGGIVENTFDGFVTSCIDCKCELVAGDLGTGDEIFDCLTIPSVPSGIFLIVGDLQEGSIIVYVETEIIYFGQQVLSGVLAISETPIGKEADNFLGEFGVRMK